MVIVKHAYSLFNKNSFPIARITHMFNTLINKNSFSIIRIKNMFNTLSCQQKPFPVNKMTKHV